MPRTASTIARPDVATLRRQYIDEKQDCVTLGALYERDPKTIWAWLKAAGIPTRGRGTDPRQQFKKGVATRLGAKLTPRQRQRVREATIARGGVPYLRNGQHWLKTAPPSANPKWKGGITPERQTFYRSPEWKAACVAVWHRADACCERCGLDHRTIDRSHQRFHVHHIASFAVVALRAEPSNLALLCRPCHLWVHSKANTNGEFIAALDAAGQDQAA